MPGNEELVKRVYVSELKEYFGFKQVSGNAESLNRWIIAPDVNRPGLELAGYPDLTDLKRVNIIGNKEMHYLNTLSEEVKKERFAVVTDSYTPCIIMTGGNETPRSLLEVAWSKNFPIFETEWKSYMTVQNVVAYLSRKLAPETSIYGVMMDIYGVGVLITGESGIGKSELALELLQRGHTFLADDLVEVARVQNDLICTPPKVLKGMLELRGIGVIDVSLMYGASSCLDSCNLDLVIRLENYQARHNENRLQYEEEKIEILGLNRPRVVLPVTPARALGTLVEAAVTNYRLNQKGYNSTEVFKKRVWDGIQEKNKKGNL